MKNIGFILGFFTFFLLTLFAPSDVVAQSCTGSYTCTGISSVCNPAGCAIGTPGCTCSTQCSPSAQSFSCSGFNQSTCGTGASWVCDELCGLQSWSCSWSSGGGGTPPGGGGGGGACTIDAHCGADSRCCAGSGGNYCTSTCYDCAGNYICAPPPPSCPAYGTSYSKYCSGNTLRETYANGTCGTVDSFLQTCQYGCSNGACQCQNGSNYSTYCSGNNLRETYTNSSCGTSDNFVSTCPHGCSSGACLPAPSPTRTCTWSGVQCQGGCGGDYYDVYSCNNGTTDSNRVPSADSACLSCAWCGPGQGSCPAATATPNSCPSFGSNASRYCSGTSIYDRYADGTCGYNTSFFFDCASGGQTCSNGACVGGSAPTTTPTTSSGSCSGSCLGYGFEGNSCGGGGVWQYLGSQGCSGYTPSCYQCVGSSQPTQPQASTPTPTPFAVEPPSSISPTPRNGTISGIVFIDEDRDGRRDSGEEGVVGVRVRVSGSNGYSSSTTSRDSIFFGIPPQGQYTLNEIPNGSATYTVIIDLPPNSDPDANYVITRPQAQRWTITASGNLNATNRDFGIYRSNPPSCTNGLTAARTTVNPGEQTVLTAATCSNIGTPPEDNTQWSATMPSDPSACSSALITAQSYSPTQLTAVWTAPSCPTSTIVCTPNITLSNGSDTQAYTRSITVPRAGQISFAVHDVSDGQACNAEAPLYTDSVVVELAGPVTTTETITEGSYAFACLPNGTYTVSLGVPAGYQMSSPPSNSISRTISDANKDHVTRFCISNSEPWFQVDSGDVRMHGIVNPIPGGQIGATDTTAPGIFYSTEATGQFDGGGVISSRNWVINRSYTYNTLTAERNGTIAYDFYRARARQEGVLIHTLSSATLDMSEITQSGVYEYPGNLTITSYTHTPGQRIVLLVNGDVTVATDIAVPPGAGNLFILAASGDIIIAESVGVDTPTSNTPNLAGYYASQGSIILEGDGCSTGTPDRRLNVSGALIANARKPFAQNGTGTIQNNRSLCVQDTQFPTLSVFSRPDFLTTLTDFYKISQTKWREVKP